MGRTSDNLQTKIRLSHQTKHILDDLRGKLKLNYDQVIKILLEYYPAMVPANFCTDIEDEQLTLPFKIKCKLDTLRLHRRESCGDIINRLIENYYTLNKKFVEQPIKQSIEQPIEQTLNVGTTM